MIQKVKGTLGKMRFMFMMALAAISLAALPAAVGAAPVDFSSTGSLDVTAADAVATGWNFMNMFGEWTTLVLGLMLATTVGGFIFWIVKKAPKFGGGKKS